MALNQAEYEQPLIAIVDDDASVRRGISSLLRSAGFKARAFPDACAYLDSEIFAQANCLVTDVSMPGMDGKALLQRVKVLLPALPVIVISAFDDGATRAAISAAGASAMLIKPFGPDALLHEIALALGQGYG